MSLLAVTQDVLRAVADYVICFECGFLLRMCRIPESDRFAIAGSTRVRRDTAFKIIAPDSDIGFDVSKEYSMAKGMHQEEPG